jgi:hypothetical protein
VEGDGWADMELFGKSKLDYLRKFLPFENGTPSDDTFRRLFRRLDPEAFKWLSRNYSEVESRVYLG